MPTRRRDIALRLNAAKSGTSPLFEALPYLKTLLISPTAAQMAASLAKNWRIVLADLDTKPCQIDADNALIWLNNRGLSTLSIMRSRFFRKSVALNALFALREAWQTTRPQDLYDRHTPTLWPHIARLLAADAATYTVRMAHEIMQHGDDESLWRYVLGEDIGDMAHHYAQNYDPKNPNAALKLAHTQWYENKDRINQTDSALLNYMDQAAITPMATAAQSLDNITIIHHLADPITHKPYLDDAQTLHDMPNAINRAHFARITDEMHSVRIGHFNVRDADLARRLLEL